MSNVVPLRAVAPSIDPNTLVARMADAGWPGKLWESPDRQRMRVYVMSVEGVALPFDERPYVEVRSVRGDTLTRWWAESRRPGRPLMMSRASAASGAAMARLAAVMRDYVVFVPDLAKDKRWAAFRAWEIAKVEEGHRQVEEARRADAVRHPIAAALMAAGWTVEVRNMCIYLICAPSGKRNVPWTKCPFLALTGPRSDALRAWWADRDARTPVEVVRMSGKRARAELAAALPSLAVIGAPAAGDQTWVAFDIAFNAAMRLERQREDAAAMAKLRAQGGPLTSRRYLRNRTSDDPRAEIRICTDKTAEQLFRGGTFAGGDSWVSMEFCDAANMGFQTGDTVIVRRSDGTEWRYVTVPGADGGPT